MKNPADKRLKNKVVSPYYKKISFSSEITF